MLLLPLSNSIQQSSQRRRMIKPIAIAGQGIDWVCEKENQECPLALAGRIEKTERIDANSERIRQGLGSCRDASDMSDGTLPIVKPPSLDLQNHLAELVHPYRPSHEQRHREVLVNLREDVQGLRIHDAQRRPF
jgi:hypothetical protein